MKRLLAALVMLTACGAQQVKIEPVQVKPIHITVDVNLHEAPQNQPPSK